MTPLVWVSSNHDDEPRDQQTDLHGPFWASCGPHGDGWSWDVMDFDQDNAEVVWGITATEGGAKAAVAAWAEENAPTPVKVHDIAGPSNSIDFGGMTVSLSPHGVEFRTVSGPVAMLQMADLQPTLNWLARHGYVGRA